MLEQFLKSLWEAQIGSVCEGHHTVGGTPHGAGAERDCEGAAEMKMLDEGGRCLYFAFSFSLF